MTRDDFLELAAKLYWSPNRIDAPRSETASAEIDVIAQALHDVYILGRKSATQLRRA